MPAIIDGSAAQDVKVRNVRIEQNTQASGSRCIVVGNQGSVVNCKTFSGEYGIAVIASGAQLHTGAVLVSGNKVSGAAEGIHVEEPDVTVNANDVHSFGGDYGINLSDADNAVVTNNRVYISGTGEDIQLYGCDNFVVANNVTYDA